METDPKSVFIPPVRVIAVRIFTPHLQKLAPVIKDSREENEGKRQVSADAILGQGKKSTPKF